MAQQKQNEDEGSSFMSVPISNNPGEDNAWKAVGSPSRRGSTIAMSHGLENTSKKISPHESPINEHIEPIRRSSVVSELNGNNNNNNNGGNNWGSFGGFQWEGPSIFDEDGKPVNLPNTQPIPPPDVVDNQGNSLLHNTNYDVLSVPMLPGVSLEPIYRQHRSLSFSMGQDPTFFGYDDYEDQPPQPSHYQSPFRSSLAPMEEEEDSYFDDLDLAHIRSRSKSSGAAFGLLSQTQHSRLMNSGHVRRGSEQHDDLLINQRRRSSSRFFNTDQPSSSQMSLGDKERLDLIQRRMSQQPQFQDYSFPETPNANYNLMRRQSLTLNTQTPTNIQQLADQLENTHLRSDLQGSNAFQQPTQQPSAQQPQYRNDLYAQHLQQQQQPQYPPPPSVYPNGPPIFPLYQQQPPPPRFSPQQQSQPLSQPQPASQTSQPQSQPPPQTAQKQQSQQIPSQVADDYFDTDPRGFQDLGKGVPISRLDPKLPLYMVEFKGGRTDFFYVLDSNQFHPQVGDLVIVEGDRGKDLGKVAANTLALEQVIVLEQRKQAQLQQLENEKDKEEDTATPAKAPREIHIKRIFRLAAPDEINLLLVKGQDEHKALVVCQQKTKQRKLPMEVVDAEYQWDRRKLTFYFEAENRIDFRELVRELFKIYKTRIWIESSQQVNLNPRNHEKTRLRHRLPLDVASKELQLVKRYSSQTKEKKSDGGACIFIQSLIFFRSVDAIRHLLFASIWMDIKNLPF
ncbi:PSP1 C-terminal conserved region-domain-containing protein [Blakeslea trispora]|nr:PSP1 C-terminal conserved region-domain-containing protein [Blakeslea trispora]